MRWMNLPKRVKLMHRNGLFDHVKLQQPGLIPACYSFGKIPSREIAMPYCSHTLAFNCRICRVGYPRFKYLVRRFAYLVESHNIFPHILYA